MKILHVLLCRGPFPAFKFGGTERVVWSLATAQKQQGHEVKFLMRPHDIRPEGTLLYDKRKSFNQQITDWPDVVHFHCAFTGELDKPFVCTEHANADKAKQYDRNTIFISQRHANNHHSDCYVYNGLDWSEYGQPSFESNSNYVHFLGKATVRHKNMTGAAKIAKKAGHKLAVLGGKRFEFGKKGYFNLDMNIDFKGMVGGDDKFTIIKQSQALLFPVRWHEPFGLAITESLFLGTPVIGTPFGSLPEIITQPEMGLLTTDYNEMVDALKHLDRFDPKVCHQVARDVFNADVMAQQYQAMYDKVLNGEYLNQAAPYATQSLLDLLPVTELMS